MADVERVSALKSGQGRRRTVAPAVSRAGIAGQRAMKEAAAAGLLDSETEAFSFRVPKSLVAAAKRETGVETNTELGRMALAVLAQRDPFTAVMQRLRGSLGPDHDLEY